MKIMDGEDIWRQVIQFVEEERWVVNLLVRLILQEI